MERRDGLMRADAITDVERPWVELVERVGVGAARDELLARGVSAAKAAGIAFWLADQSRRVRHCSRDTARSYRSELESLEPPARSPIRLLSSSRRSGAIPG